MENDATICDAVEIYLLHLLRVQKNFIRFLVLGNTPKYSALSYESYSYKYSTDRMFEESQIFSLKTTKLKNAETSCGIFLCGFPVS